MHKAQVNTDKKMSQLPGWLWPNSNVLSPLYKKIWEAVQEDRCKQGAVNGELLVDTNKIFPLLLTSQLPTEVLGYIWSLANQKYAGQLTEQELYIVLALVALAQASYPFNSLEVLYFIRIPPTPNLNLSLLDTVALKNETKIHVSPFESPTLNSSISNKKYPNSNKLASKSSNLPTNIEGPYINYNLPDVREVNFCSDDTPSYNTNIGYADSRPSIYNQAEIKHQISSYSTDSNDDFSDFQSAPISSASSSPNVWDSKQGSAIGSRLANHNLGVKKLNDKVKKAGANKSSSNNQLRNVVLSNSFLHSRETQLPEKLPEIFPKCTVKTQAKTVILKDTIIRNSDQNETLRSSAKDFLSISEKTIVNKVDPVIKTPNLKNNDLSYVVSKESKDALHQDLMNLQPAEDKYSALRALVEGPSISKNKLEHNDLGSIADDFGDFVSAQQSEPILNKLPNPISSVDLLSDLDFKPEIIIGSNNKPSPNLIQEISHAFNALEFEETGIIEQTEKAIQKEDALSVNSIELGLAPVGVLTRSGSVPSLDLKSFLPSSQEDEHQIENMHQMIYWEWKQYMESCVLLLQVSVNIFTSITSEIILKEVLSSAQGYNFLCNLAEVAAVCRRVNYSHKEMDINIMGFDDLLLDIDRVWSEMEPFYSNIPIVTELPSWPLHQGDGVTCSLCLTIITNGRVIYNDNNYHATCANLWLHTVNTNLPVLRYPISYMQSTISQSANHT